ncbi:hypothetical protein L484_009695 [Morus notabilis]|uniref:Pentatricopeptide repeat-containing protein n=1 Tax=Morus notabilis TaxID=981085 RepID=W9SGD8_9ROSA|nr:hypothetical protein L484_009695 [Morus notabilis]
MLLGSPQPLSAKALSLRLFFFSLSDSLSPFISFDCRRRSPQNLCSSLAETSGSGCSCAGLVEEGWHFFESMKNGYSIVPSQDHYACMVDLLSRSGRLKTAYELLKLMPVEPHAGAWGALLGACKLHCNIEIGELVASKLLEIEPQNAGNYVLLSNIYAAAERWLDVSLVRNKMKERGVKKIPGRSWISSEG